MQSLKVNCDNNKSKVLNLVVGWLLELGAKDITPENALSALSGMVLIIPHESWVYHNLSGSSVPPFVKLDYSNKVCAVQKTENAEEYLSLYHKAHPTFEVFGTHYNSDGALCGAPKDDNWQEMTDKINDVTCPHCLLEIMVRIPINSLVAH